MFFKIFQHRLFQQFAQMTFWRTFALVFGATASIWAARCLGPENLGISAMVIAISEQAMLLVALNLNPLLVREYKRRDEEGKDDLMATVFTYRLMVAAMLGILIASGMFLAGVSAKWWLAILAGVPYFILISNDSVWALQARENLPAQHRALAIKSLLTASMFFIFFRPGIGPGWDVVVQVIAVGIAMIISWKWAMENRAFSLVNFQKLKAIKTLVKEGRWLFLTGVVIYIYNSLGSPLLAWLYSVKELGIFRTAILATGALQSFLLLISGLLYPRFIEWQKNGFDFFWQRQKILFYFGLLCLIPITALTFLGAPWFYKLYGSKFATAAYPFALLATSKYINTLGSIFTFGLWAQSRDRAMLFVIGLAAIFSLCANLLLIPRYGMWAVANVNLGSEILILLGALILAQRKKREMR